MSQEGVVFALAVAMFAVFAVTLNNFLTAGNLIALVRSVSILGILGLGMGLVVIGRGIDLDAARGGLVSALMAQCGVEGPPQPLEGPRGFLKVCSDQPRPELIEGGLGRDWEILRNMFKPYSCGVVLNPVIDACLTARANPNFSAGRIAEVVVRGAPLLKARADRPEVTHGARGASERPACGRRQPAARPCGRRRIQRCRRERSASEGPARQGPPGRDRCRHSGRSRSCLDPICGRLFGRGNRKSRNRQPCSTYVGLSAQREICRARALRLPDARRGSACRHALDPCRSYRCRCSHGARPASSRSGSPMSSSSVRILSKGEFPLLFENQSYRHEPTPKAQIEV
ncbi:exported hypothetical protein [Mesorhizobium sp. STM 4661]|nr:exported hypothetical protein [Mesorhizobium sp. STM 4661]